MNLKTITLFFITALLAGCSDKNTDIEKQGEVSYDWNKHIPFESEYFADGLPLSNKYSNVPVEVGTLRLEESSGIAWSIKNPGMLWTHEDSGNGNMLYLIDASTAEIVAQYRIINSINTDWEDIEVTIDTESQKSYIYISDTGDNDLRRNSYTVYKLEEPAFNETDRGKTVNTDGNNLQSFRFKYPDGNYDTEGTFTDPVTKDIFLVTKRDEVSRVYVLPYPQTTGTTSSTFLVGTLGFKETSAATINFKGDKIIIRNRQHLFFWERNVGETIAQTLARMPVRLPYAGEIQGEAVCFDTADNYYTSSEKDNSPVYPPLVKYQINNN